MLRWVWLAIGLCACAAPSRPQPAAAKLELPELRALRYTLAPDAQLHALGVELCFEGQPPERLIYAGPKAVPFLRNPRELGSQRALPVERGAIVLRGLAADSCIAYAADLRAALDADALMLAYPGEQALLFGSELFLWRPAHRSPQLQATLRMRLPEGMQASTPWREHAGAYVLDETAFAFTGHLVLGRFDASLVPAPGSSLRTVILRGFPEASRAILQAWLQRAAEVASSPGGFFPVADAQVIVVPTSPSSFPIHFGHTGRSGGASIVLFMPTDVSADDLRDDWIAVHEFSHLWHPFIVREDAWLSEGLATYLQELLRTHAGSVAPAQLWQRLYRGASLGRDVEESLQHETRIMPFAHNYQRVYWAGAAIALMLDVELRRASHGALTLERMLARLRRDRVRFEHATTARELLRAIDQLAGVAVCERLAERQLTTPRFPELSGLYRELGVSIDARGDVTQTDAPLAWVRDAIQRGAPDPG